MHSKLSDGRFKIAGTITLLKGAPTESIGNTLIVTTDEIQIQFHLLLLLGESS